MKRKAVYPLIVLIIYIVGIFVISYQSVGQPSRIEIFSWHVPYDMLIFISIPALLGYFVGRYEK